MKNTTVVSLGRVRDLLAQWDMAREEILAGRLAGFHLVLKDDHGDESIYAGGVYRSDHEAALRAVLKTSMIRMACEDQPLPPMERLGT